MGPDAALRSLLRAVPDAIVVAIGDAGTIVPVPPAVPLSGQHVFDGRSALDLLIPEDQPVVVQAWTRAQTEPVVVFEVRLLAAPEHVAVAHLFDVRAEYGVRVVVVESADVDAVARSAEIRSTVRRRIGRSRRDALSTFVDVDDDTVELLGWSREQLLGRSTVDLIHPDDAQQAIDNWMQMRTEGGSRRSQLRLQHALGHYVWFEVTNENRLDDPDFGCVVSEMIDISEDMARLEALHQRERLLARQAEALPIGICQLRATGEVAYSNRPLADLFGPVDGVDALLAGIAPPDRAIVRRSLELAFEGGHSDLEVGIGIVGTDRRCELTFRTMTSDDGEIDGVILCAADVTDRSRLRSELEHRANHDALTSCLNRAATIDAVERSLRAGATLMFAFIDLDDFKTINDEIGHAAGDELLRVAAQRLRSAIRETDVLGRFGGDEFVVVSAVRDGDVEPAMFADRLTEAIGGDVVFAGRRIALRASVGAAVSTDGEVDVEALFRRADAAMYAVKRGGHRGERALAAARPGLT